VALHALLLHRWGCHLLLVAPQRVLAIVLAVVVRCTRANRASGCRPGEPMSGHVPGDAADEGALKTASRLRRRGDHHVQMQSAAIINPRIIVASCVHCPDGNVLRRTVVASVLRPLAWCLMRGFGDAICADLMPSLLGSWNHRLSQVFFGNGPCGLRPGSIRASQGVGERRASTWPTRRKKEMTTGT
jgi:hypothetical protein